MICMDPLLLPCAACDERTCMNPDHLSPKFVSHPVPGEADDSCETAYCRRCGDALCLSCVRVALRDVAPQSCPVCGWEVAIQLWPDRATAVTALNRRPSRKLACRILAP